MVSFQGNTPKNIGALPFKLMLSSWEKKAARFLITSSKKVYCRKTIWVVLFHLGPTYRAKFYFKGSKPRILQS